MVPVGALSLISLYPTQHTDCTLYFTVRNLRGAGGVADYETMTLYACYPPFQQRERVRSSLMHTLSPPPPGGALARFYDHKHTWFYGR